MKPLMEYSVRVCNFIQALIHNYQTWTSSGFSQTRTLQFLRSAFKNPSGMVFVMVSEEFGIPIVNGGLHYNYGKVQLAQVLGHCK